MIGTSNQSVPVAWPLMKELLRWSIIFSISEAKLPWTRHHWTIIGIFFSKSKLDNLITYRFGGLEHVYLTLYWEY